jgi:aspartyl-tRNA(Asn)/glutamyl-tRNA(Gln) amidotransferase subunit C
MKMTITAAEVEHIAMLARLKLSPAEKEAYSEQLNAILDDVDKLNELDTAAVEPTAYLLPLRNVFRDDIARPVLRKLAQGSLRYHG